MAKTWAETHLNPRALREHQTRVADMEAKALADFEAQCAADEARIEMIAEQYFYERGTEL